MKQSFEQFKTPENKDKKDFSRRRFLKIFAGFSAGVMAKKIFGEEIPTGEEGIKYIKERTKELSSEEEKSPGFGIFERDALTFQYLIMPRNEQELRQLEEFLAFVHGRDYRKEVFDQMTTYEEDPKEFDEVGWKFYEKYFKGRKMARIEPKSVDEEKLIKRYEILKKMLDEETAMKMAKREIEDNSSSWNTEEIKIDISEFGLKEITPSVIARHEADHVSQESKRVQFSGESTVRECICIFDGVEMALIDKYLRRKKGLSENEDENKKLLYSKPIKFPSGATYEMRNLVAFAERFFDIDKGTFSKTFVEMLSDPSAVSFFDNLIYKNPGRNYRLIKEAKKIEEERRKRLEDFERNKKEILKKYIEEFLRKHAKDLFFLNEEIFREEDFNREEVEEVRKMMLKKLEENPEELHIYLVEMLEKEDDPKYSIRPIYSRLGGVGRPLYYNATLREFPETIRDLIEDDRETQLFWQKYQMVVDRDPEGKY